MLINTQIIPSGDLRIDAYTYSSKEFAAIESVLAVADIKPLFKRIPPDKSNRDGRQYTVPANQIANLEVALEGTFETTGQFVPLAGSGRNYACHEIRLSGRGTGCKDMTAPSDAIAQMKCAMIARNNNWFGGVPKPGTCRR